MLVLTPAYGRRYSTPQSAIDDWKLGKDFKILLGPYTSIRDINLLKKDFGKVLIKWYFEGLYVEVTNEVEL